MFNKTDKIEQLEERSASHAHAGPTCEYNLWVNYSHFAACINFFLPLDYS